MMHLKGNRAHLAFVAAAAVVTVVGVQGAPRLRAQSPPTQLAAASAPAFEVASIKPDKSGDGASTIGFRAGGRFLAVNEPLERLRGAAYATTFALPRKQIIGGPAWIDTDRWDVDAVAQGSPSSDRQKAMLRALLGDRFKLVTHAETRDLPIYILVKSRNDGRLGEKLRRSAIDCAALRTSEPAPPPAPSGPPPCVMGFGSGRLSGSGMTVSQLATAALTRLVDRLVVDRTGLDGAYDWTLEWTPNPSAQGQLDSLGAPGAADPDRTSIFTAVQEQLGLKLESATGPADVVVIDRAERPTSD